MNDITKNMDNILGVESESVEPEIISESTEIVPAKQAKPPAVIVDRDVEYDYELSRTTQRDLIDQGAEALEGILRVAQESQHPRAYEVVGNLLKIQSDIVDKLLSLHEKKKALQGKDAPVTQQVNVDKAVFVGSTSDLLKKIKQDQQN